MQLKQHSKIKQAAESKVQAGAEGGIETVVKAINIHIKNPSVCKYGCGALWNMTCKNGKALVSTK